MIKHTFAICAYKESPYLEELIRSLLSQKMRSSVILCTSTPNEYIENLCKKYNIRMFVSSKPSSLMNDWSFALKTAHIEDGAELVTIAHQDDIYQEEYSLKLNKAYEKYPDMLLFCSSNKTIDAYGNESGGKVEAVKKILRLPLRLKMLSGSTLIKRLPLRFGNSICCPSCTYNIKLTGTELFNKDYHFVIDWDTLWNLTNQKGRFIVCEKNLISYRVHDGAETKKNIIDHNREKEEFLMFRRIWPEFFAKFLMHFYKSAYKAYD